MAVGTTPFLLSVIQTCFSWIKDVKNASNTKLSINLLRRSLGTVPKDPKDPEKASESYKTGPVDSPAERKSIAIKLKKHDISLTLQVPEFGDARRPAETEASARVLLAHSEFKAALVPGVLPTDAFYDQCAAEVQTIRTFFPHLASEAIHTVFAAWLTFVCTMDDILETLPAAVGEQVLAESIQMVQGRPLDSAVPGAASDTRIQGLTRVLYAHATALLSPAGARAFFGAAQAVLEAHVDEIRFLQGGLPRDLATYLGIRRRTIALAPFFEVLKSEYLPAGFADGDATAWAQLQTDVSCAAGLQNDLIGLERDLEGGEQLNAVVVLMRGSNPHAGSAAAVDEALLTRCVGLVAAEHNKAVTRSLAHAARILSTARDAAPAAAAAVAAVARHIMLLSETHLTWCAGCKRYDMAAGTPPPPPPPLANADPGVTAVMGPQLAPPRGIYHGLPTYPANAPALRGLTALVTGATGVSGYQMVKVLAAAPKRWAKVYCLSARPPPDNFFRDLGEGARRVEHIAIDFLADPALIARQLKDKIPSVDHIFYFSYMQPAPKGNVLDLWANADELATVNSTLFTNFTTALQKTQLRPRRFMLQTGSKHYAFYLGPAALPAFESDARVALARNFYYEQEDALFRYCGAVGARWTVARPSYIVGAVRDGALNHLVGLAVYAAVQARLGRPLAFPGDYRAWDREQVQSTGGLNAYFEEWLALAEGVEDQAFNIHDGLSFTWGRLWPLLAGWYSAAWAPPEADVAKYRAVTLPYPETPRGHGPQMTLNSTFSLLEWSLRPEVEQTWGDLAREHGLVLDPFHDRYRARIFSFADSAVIGDAPMTTSVRKARQFGFFGTVDSYHSIFDTLHELAQLKLVVAPVVNQFDFAS
ncbi:hypothetical protein B0H67DRAFT_586144 [Lasiosphaeris hirsuta]|uniref:PRISE-like Rossmann-fold domain-containing protein n=1 Tax=Lasiosphaeris hirsuta TaxID=260670 RepID=A0AA40A9E5_9PEZI|nr:hypothetical protein B0H67DRAFT_586144 [Lasiosphaeris hirsuta]